MYEVSITKDAWTPLSVKHFRHSTDGSLADQQTLVSLKYDADALYVKFECRDNSFISQNAMINHNDSLFNQEVFEVFIAPSTADPVNYLEFEINPNNAIWVGHVFNPTMGDTSGTKLTMVPYNEAKITHHVNVNQNTWSGDFAIPWTLIGEPNQDYRINFYRIVSKVPHNDPNWVCNAHSCDFTCWSPTMSGASPAFHKPKMFGLLSLV